MTDIIQDGKPTELGKIIIRLACGNPGALRVLHQLAQLEGAEGLKRAEGLSSEQIWDHRKQWGIE